MVPPLTEDTGDTCRICRGEATPEQPLFYPCKCSGSIKYVHQNCLMEWLSHSQKKYCELCKTPFRFTKLYDQSMPEHVPWLLFGKQVVIHSIRAFGRWARYSIVTFIWLCWLPWTIRQIWRALFWIADGSWLTTEELESAVQEYGSQLANTTTMSLSDAIANATLTHSGVTSVGFFSTMVAIFSLLDPHTILRFLFRSILQLAIWPTMKGEPIRWEGAFLFAPMPRPASLLSDFETLTSATRFPILNNAILDILEGQLVCLTIVTAFILIFLIREWVINQQPLLNQPEEEQPENAPAAQPADEERRAARRRRRALRQLANDNMQLENRDRPRAQPRPRRRATENNILVPDPVINADRPPAPPRAQSLVPALQELEDNARLLGDIGSGNYLDQSQPVIPTVESPPLQRGTFDEVGQIQRAIEETSHIGPTPSLLDQEPLTSLEPEEPHPNRHLNFEQGTPPTDGDAGVPATFQPPSGQGDFTFRTDHEIAEPGLDQEQRPFGLAPVEVAKSDSDTDAETLLTPESSQTADEPPEIAEDDQIEVDHDAVEPEEDDNQSTSATELTDEPAVEDKSMLGRLTEWLWHTDDLMLPENTETEIVANIGAQDQVIHGIEGHDLGIVAPAADAAAPVPVAPQPQQNPPLPVPAAVANNDQNAIDDAEDLEGVLELLGMEGPIAGMVQNIIFSVFLITLTLSASVWCPYIWGKITLLFVAHPFSVFIKAPLFLLSKTADFIIDLGLLMIGLSGMLLNNLAKMVKLATFPFIPRFSGLLNTELMDKLSSSLSHNSGARLERSIAKTLLGFRPDLPTFSVQSHHVLRVFSGIAKNSTMKAGTGIYTILTEAPASLSQQSLQQIVSNVISALRASPRTLLSLSSTARQWFATLQHDLRPISFAKLDEIDYSLIQWSASEKIVCVLLGYTLFTTVGYAYMRICRRVLGLKQNEKVPGMLADSLRQAGGVIKVIVIIGIEMIVFPLYCGTMLDFALLPLFKGATLPSRLQFFAHAPLTALFVHWFLGTCYMFHFALFVSMCRKLMRRGVLYFIRDPDDPSFHPVRDVLERPVATQLGKIAFSAFVYGSLLVICLGGVVSGLSRIGNILPIRWGAQEPLMIIPGDIIFYNFMLPFILRKVDVSKRLSELFGWWFRACAAGLRLSDFLFGVDSEEEKKTGAFLWKRFLKVALHGNDEAKHPMVKYVEDLASHLDRLLWFEAVEGTVDNDFVIKILGFSPNFKIMNIINDRSEALLEFGQNEDMTLIRKIIDEEIQKTDSRCRVKHVKDIKVDAVEKTFTRNTPIDTSAGSYVRAPAKDSVRIPKGTAVFVQVDEKNARVDGIDDNDTGLHGKTDERFSRIYIPNHFRARVTAFIGLIWFFVAIAGLLFSVGPLLLGRSIIRLFDTTTPVNDLYALTIGVHIFGVFIFIAHFVKLRYAQSTLKIANAFKNGRNALPMLFSLTKRVAGLMYLSISLGFITPMALSMLAELYINIPAYTYLVAGDAKSDEAAANPLISTTQGAGTRPVIHILQTWAMGILYLRILLRFVTAPAYENTRPATAVKAIIRGGLLRPDVGLASRALILPTLVLCTVLLGLPPLIARTITALYTETLGEHEIAKIYRYTYPILLTLAFNLYTARKLLARIERWRVKIRDEVYLIGERLHNFPAQEDGKAKKRTKGSAAKGKVKAGTVPKIDTIAEKLTASEVDSAIILGDRIQEMNVLPDHSGDNEPVRDLDQDIHDFKEATGLDGLPGAADVGDFGRSVFEAT